MLHRGLDEHPPLLIGQRQELAGRAEDDDAGDAGLDLPVDEALPGRKIDLLAALGEGGDGDGVAAAELGGHRELPPGSIAGTKRKQGSRRTRYWVCAGDGATATVYSVYTRDASCAMGKDVTKTDVLIVGGGLAGAATAYFLAREGVEVTLLERDDLNTQASGSNAGSIHAQIPHEPFMIEGEDGRGSSPLPSR
jgi:Glycine/D-amino acid oxidases (deaminating)